MDGRHRFYAHINRAASDYYYTNRQRLGIKSPPQNSFWKAAVKIAAYNESGDALGLHCKDCRFAGILPRLEIFSRDGSDELPSIQVYATTIHELAHASHWEFRKNNSQSTEKRLKESWADGLEWIFTVFRYGQYGDRTAYNDSYQRRRVTTDDFGQNYTPIAVDLFDMNDQSQTCSGVGCIRDRVHGFTFKEMEDALHGASGFAQWRDNLAAQSGHAHLSADLNELFDNYLR